MSEIPELKTLEEGVASEANLAALRTFITPNDLHFVRSRYPAPVIDEKNWRLTVDGEVEQSLKLTLEDLRAMPQKTLPVTMECAGNGRTHLDPPTPGLQFGNGAVGTAEWTGVPLLHVLEKAGLKATAVELCMQAEDQNPETGDGEPEFYERGLALDKALDPDTLLAYQMNGEDLSVEHGFPLRAIVPGWYGMASVKWLNRIIALDRTFEGHFNLNEYVIKKQGEETVPVTTMRVKSLITCPGDGDVLQSGTHVVSGVAWSPFGIDYVEISTDSAESWGKALLDESKSRYAWRRWMYEWEANQLGEYTLMARACDANGNRQPMMADWNELGYVINPVHSIKVVVS